LKLIKRHLNPATVISCIALFVALGGAAYAAKTVVRTQNIVNGAVTTAKLRNGAVTTAKLRNRAVTTAKLGNGAVGTGQLGDGSVRSGQLGGQVVTEAKIKNSAVTTNKLGAESVATGKLSNEAVTAAKLSAGFYGQLVKDVSYASETTATNKTDHKSVTATCPAGKEAIGGGYRVIPGEISIVGVTESYPVTNGEGKRTAWTVAGDGTEEKTWGLEAHAVCAEL